MSWVGSIVAIGTTVYGASQQKKAAKAAAQASTPTPYSVYGPGGSMQVSNGQLNLGMADNPFYDMLSGVGMGGFANAAVAPGSYLYGANPELAAAYQASFGPGLEQEAAGRKSILDQLAQPEEQRSYNNLQDQLFAQGRLGTSGGGVQQEAFQNSLREADLRRQLASQDWAQTRANNRFGNALKTIEQGMAGQKQNFGIGFDSLTAQGNIFQQMMDQARLGVGAAKN